MVRNLAIGLCAIALSTMSLKAQEKTEAVIEQNQQEKKAITISENPAFPKYEVTGNKEKDEETYRKKKEQWISNNPEEYEKMKEGKDQSQPKQ